MNRKILKIVLVLVISLSVGLLPYARADIASDIKEGKLSLQQVVEKALVDLSAPDIVTQLIAAGVNPVLAAVMVPSISIAGGPPWGECEGGFLPGKPCADDKPDCPDACVGGTKDGKLCVNDSDCPNACVGGSKDGHRCDNDSDCPGGTCSDIGACTNIGECKEPSSPSASFAPWETPWWQARTVKKPDVP